MVLTSISVIIGRLMCYRTLFMRDRCYTSKTVKKDRLMNPAYLKRVNLLILFVNLPICKNQITAWSNPTPILDLTSVTSIAVIIYDN